MPEYGALDLHIENQVATIKILGHEEASARAKAGKGTPGGRHREMADVFDALRADDSVRVIVLTGAGPHFAITATHEQYTNPARLAVDSSNNWRNFGSLVRVHQAMCEIEKPIVAKVNGHAVGFGHSMVFASDIIVAREDALLMDHHMGGVMTITEDGQEKHVGHEFSSVPGDGGAQLLPLYMSPAKAKEYLMLAEPHTAKELAQLGIINYAVPADQLDGKVDEIVQKLLRRGAYPLAWTKRIVNRRVADQLNRTLDAAVGYEMVGFLYREKQGGEEKRTLS